VFLVSQLLPLILNYRFPLLPFFLENGFLFFDVVLEGSVFIVILIGSIVAIQNFIDFLLNIQRQILHELAIAPTV